MRVLIKTDGKIRCLETNEITYGTDITQRTLIRKETHAAILFWVETIYTIKNRMFQKTLEAFITEDIDEEEGKRLIREINEKGFLDLTAYKTYLAISVD